MNILQGLFNRWMGSSFRPITYNQLLGTKTPVLIDTGNLMDVYQSVPHLRIAIDKKAEMLSNMEIKLYDDMGEVTDHPVLSLFTKPNPLQSTEKFISQYSMMLNIYANSFIYKNVGMPNSLPLAMWVFPSGDMQVNNTGKLFQQVSIEGIIESYEIVSTHQIYSPKDVLHISNGDAEQYYIGKSKIYTLALPISNILASLKSRNILITERGAIGILSSASKDSDGGVPLGREERERIERQYQRDRGLDSAKGHVVVTNSQLTWQPMTIAVRDLMLFEEIEDDFAAILGAYGLARDLFPSVKGATFENQKEALRTTYQNTIQPEADGLMNSLTSFLGLNKEGLKLVADYSWLPCMKEDEKRIQEIETAKVTALHQQFYDGAITIDEYRMELGKLPKEATLDNSQQDKIVNAQVSLRGTVGGVTGIIDINASVANGTLDKNTATNILINIYGFDQATAQSMITNLVIGV
jgi:HK97 family phage portal protein